METIKTKRDVISQTLTEFLAYKILISYVSELTTIYNILSKLISH